MICLNDKIELDIFNFYYVGVRVNLHTPWLISRILKLTTM
jgi:hypothetical protein